MSDPGTQTDTLHDGPPWNYPEFVVCAGRYFLAHYFMDLPVGDKLPKGGNVAMLVWRFDDEPERWRLVINFRYYRDAVAIGSTDRKNWNLFAVTKTEAEMAEHSKETMELMSGAAGLCFLKQPPEIYSLQVRGDWKKYQQAVATQKPFWLHGPELRDHA